MMKKFNWRLALLVFICLETTIFLTGCTETVAALGPLLTSLGTLLNAIIAFATGLGSTITPAAQQILTDIGAAVTTAIPQAQADIAAWTQATSSTVLSKVGALLSGIPATVNSLLAAMGISGSAEQKLSEIIGLAVTAVEGILAFVPLVASELSPVPEQPAKTEEQKSAIKKQLERMVRLDKIAAKQVKTLHQSMRDSYKEWVTMPTGDDKVDSVLKSLPQELP
jgi:hypothetical protein